MHCVTSTCLHPNPPQSHFCRLRSPPASASASSPAVAPLWTSNDLWDQVDRHQSGKKTVREMRACDLLPGFSSSLRSSPSTPGCCCSSSWVLALRHAIINNITKRLNLIDYAHHIFCITANNLEQIYLVWQWVSLNDDKSRRLHSHRGKYFQAWSGNIKNKNSFYGTK